MLRREAARAEKRGVKRFLDLGKRPRFIYTRKRRERGGGPIRQEKKKESAPALIVATRDPSGCPQKRKGGKGFVGNERIKGARFLFCEKKEGSSCFARGGIWKSYTAS